MSDEKSDQGQDSIKSSTNFQINKIRSDTRLYFVFVFFMIVSVSLGYVVYGLNTSKQEIECTAKQNFKWISKSRECVAAVVPPVEEKPKELPVQIPPNMPIYRKFLVLYHKNSRGGESLITRTNDYSYTIPIIRWNDEIIYANPNETDKGKTDVIVQNIFDETTEVLVPYTVIDKYSSGEIIAVPKMLGFTLLLNDKLYLSYGGYLSDPFILQVDLNTKKYKKIADGSSIEKIGYDYFITDEVGDGGGHFKRYSLFDPETQKVSGRLEITTGSHEGEELVGIDVKSRSFVLLSYNSDVNNGRNFLSISKVSFDNLSKRTVVVSNADMPKNMIGYMFDNTSGVLYLGTLTPQTYGLQPENNSGKLFSVDIGNSKLQEIGTFGFELDETQGYAFKNLIDGNLCVEIITYLNSDSEYGRDVLVDSQTANVIENDSLRCEELKYKVKEADRDFSFWQFSDIDETKKYVDDLNLPAAYYYTVQ